MEILGIGPFEIFFILLIALIILGPGDMVKTGRTIGRFMRKVVTSSEWHTVQKASRELKYLPNRLMREASIEDLSKDINEINKIGKELNQDVRQVQSDLTSWTTPPELMNFDETSANSLPAEDASPVPDPLTGADPSNRPGLPNNPDQESTSD